MVEKAGAAASAKYCFIWALVQGGCCVGALKALKELDVVRLRSAARREEPLPPPMRACRKSNFSWFAVACGEFVFKMWAVPECPCAPSVLLFFLFLLLEDFWDLSKDFNGVFVPAYSRDVNPALRRVSRLDLVLLTDGGVQQ
jgi:hypothetical protein|tara:strand:- start:188 stop:613 length:426 start_codon:yes stop_codon:yes gene_type:complete